MGSDCISSWSLLIFLLQAFEKVGYPCGWNNNIIHERSRPIWERDLAPLIFVQHIRKLTIKFVCLFQFWFINAVTISPLKGWNTLSVFLLTIYVSIEVSWVSLNVTNQVIDIQIVLLFNIGLYFPSQSFNFDLSLLLPVFFAFACVLFLLRIFLLISGLSKGPKIPTYWF